MLKDLDQFDVDLIEGPRRRARVAYLLGGIGVAIGIAGIAAAVSILPLKEIQTHVVVVDKTSGHMDRVARVQSLTLDESDAVIQANLVSYVDDRETYDLTDSEVRINSVLTRSLGDAEQTLRAQWAPENENYPIKIYGRNNKIDVVIQSVNQLNPGVAQVRFKKTRRDIVNKREVTRSFVATVGFEFRPETKQTLREVWANPLGFVVTSYRVDAETLEAQQ